MSYQKDSHLSSYCTAGNGIEQLCSSNTCTYLGSSVILSSQAELFSIKLIRSTNEEINAKDSRLYIDISRLAKAFQGGYFLL